MSEPNSKGETAEERRVRLALAARAAQHDEAVARLEATTTEDEVEAWVADDEAARSDLNEREARPF